MSIIIELLGKDKFFLRVYEDNIEKTYTTEDEFLTEDLTKLLHLYFSYIYDKEKFIKENNEKEIKFESLIEIDLFRKGKKCMLKIFDSKIKSAYKKIIELSNKKIL